MYELELANEEVKLNFFKSMVKVIKHKKQPLLPYAIKEYIRSINPNIPIYIIRPIVSRAIEKLKAFSNMKIENFKSEEEAQDLCKKMISDLFDSNEDKEFENILNMYYDLCKYDKKITIDGKEYLFNWFYIMTQWELHYEADQKWLKLNEVRKKNEQNFNISHNNQTVPKKQTKFLSPSYKIHEINPLMKENDILINSEIQIETELIKEFEIDSFAFARTISEMNNTAFEIDKIKNEDFTNYIKANKRFEHSLNSDTPIQRKDIVYSFLTNIALLYKSINPSEIKMTELQKFINTIAKTTIFKNEKNVFPIDQLRNGTIREIQMFYDLRLIEFTDNRRKIKRSKENMEAMENYMNFVTSFINRHIT